MCECKPENELYYRNNNEYLGVREVFIGSSYDGYEGNLVICTGKKIKEYEKENILIKINYCPMCGKKLSDIDD